MFRKREPIKNKRNSSLNDEINELELNEENINENKEENSNSNIINNESYLDVKLIKSEIDKKFKKRIKKGIEIKAVDNRVTLPLKKEEPRENTIKKVFVSEALLQNANPDEMQKLLGIKREDVDKLRVEKRKGLIQMQKELYSLPQNLEAHSNTKNDYVDNLLRLSNAGLIEVPLPLEQKLKNIEETEKLKKQIIDNKLAEELDYLKVLKKLGPSYAKGYKSDLSHKTIAKLNNVFENVFLNENGRVRKLKKAKIIAENRMTEESIFK
jgi:hypothetical protein